MFQNDTTLVAAFLTSFVAITLTVANNFRDNRIRRQEAQERERVLRESREREDLNLASLVSIAYFVAEDSIVVAITNYGELPILDLQIEGQHGEAEFSAVKGNQSGEGISLNISTLTHEDWLEVEYIMENGVHVVPPKKTYVFGGRSHFKQLQIEDIIVTFRLPSGYAFGSRQGQIFRYPPGDLELGEKILAKKGMFT